MFFVFPSQSNPSKRGGTLLFVTCIVYLGMLACVVQGYKLGQCKATNGLSMGEDCMCAYTDDGVDCEANYYCPSYTIELATENKDTLEGAPNRCNVDLSSNPPVVKCPCPPGFYCPTNTSQPAYCCNDYYCPNDPDGVPIDDDGLGLGTWGGKAYICPEGKWCQAAQIEPFDCPPLSRCDEGVHKANKGGQWAMLILAIIFICIGFFLLDYKRKRARMLQKLTYQQDTSHDAEPNQSNGLNSPLNNPAAASSTTGGSEDRKSFLIEFEDIGLVLKNGTTIMEGVNGKFSPGRLCAIMGPSGAGKTTVISLVTGKAQKTSGKVLVNGEEEDGLSKYRKLVGFVPQEDVMIRSLSVRDNISFSANYRLPVSCNETEINRKVNACIQELGVSHVQHSIIGDERTRGVSGGQRKRVNIGIELVADPSVLFLDEPTSGLDSTTATALCSTLKKIAQKKLMTIAAVIHQPSLSSFMEFDDLLLLGKGGKVVYQGPLQEAPVYFKNIGFDMPDNCNPADFYLDLCQGAVPRKGHPTFAWEELFDLWIEHINKGPAKTGATRMSSVSLSSNARELNSRIAAEQNKPAWRWPILMAFKQLTYDIEDWFMTLKTDLRAWYDNIGKKDPVRETPGFFRQFVLCTSRALKQVFTTPSEFIMELMVHLGIGLLISQGAKKLKYIGPYPYPLCLITSIQYVDACQLPINDNYVQTANFMCFGILFASVATASATFGSEQVNYWRECAAGLQSTPYFVGKFIANFPRIVGATLFFFISFQVSFQNAGPGDDLFTLVLALYWFGFAIGYVVSQVVPPNYASMAGVLIALIFAVGLSGVNPSLVDINDRAPIRQVPWYVSGPRWVLEAFYVSQVKYYTYIPDGLPYEGAPYIDTKSGLDAKAYDIDAFSKDIRALFLCGFGWSIVALVLMLFTYRDKKK